MSDNIGGSFSGMPVFEQPKKRKKCYYKAMKKQLVILAALAVVLVCLSVAVIYSNDRGARNKTVTTTQVKALQAQLTREQAVSALHDAANTANIKNAGDQILTLQTQKTTLCTQIKAARLTQPLCQ